MKLSGLKAAYALVVLCGLAYAFVELRSPNGIPGWLDKRREVHQYEVTNEQLHREIEEKQQRIKELESDPQTQDMIIRERLKLAAPGETVYIIPGKKK